MQPKVLIIDDERDICKLLNTFLTHEGYEVYTAHTLSSGLSLMKETTPDIVFLDNNLPDGLGWDKIEEIQQYVPMAKINLISAYKFIPQSIRDKPSIRLIEKPISFASLRNYL